MQGYAPRSRDRRDLGIQRPVHDERIVATAGIAGAHGHVLHGGAFDVPQAVLGLDVVIQQHAAVTGHLQPVLVGDVSGQHRQVNPGDVPRLAQGHDAAVHGHGEPGAHPGTAGVGFVHGGRRVVHPVGVLPHHQVHTGHAGDVVHEGPDVEGGGHRRTLARRPAPQAAAPEAARVPGQPLGQPDRGRGGIAPHRDDRIGQRARLVAGQGGLDLHVQG